MGYLGTISSSTHHYHRPLRLFNVLQPCKYRSSTSYTKDTDRTRMTSLPSSISSVINIWLCLISLKDNRGRME